MKNVFFFLIAIVSIGFYSCQKEPTASFTASKTTATVNETISFTNSSLEGHSFKWEFGDGTTSTEENPSHAYVSSGTYIVKLTVYSKKEKKSDDATVNITVTDLVPVANFSFSGAGGNAPCTVSFTNSSTNATSYSWDFGDGGTSTETNPQHTYTSGGTFTVQLTATGNGGSNSITKTVNVLNPVGPVASFTYSGAGNYAPCNVTFTNTSQNATSYSWNFGDGGTSTATNPSHTFTTGGTFTVQLTATGTGGSNTTSQTVNILAPPTKCYLKKVTITAMPFTDGSGAGWDIYNGPDVFIEITNANNVVYQTGTTVSNVTSSMLPLTWNWSTPWQFPSLTTNYYVDLTDYDTPDPNDYIGWCGPFKMSDYMTTFPTTMTKTANGITITIEVQWGN